MAYTKLGWVNGGAPALSGPNLEHMDAGIDAADEKLDALGVQSTLDAEATPDDTDYVLVKDTEDAGKVKKTLLSEIWTWIKTNLGSDKAAVLSAINVEDGADVTDATNVQAALTADQAGGRSALALGDCATLDVGTTAGDVAAGNAPAGAVTTHESTYAHAYLPTANEKTRLSDIQAASGATTALKLANLTSLATNAQQGVALLGASGGAAKLTTLPDGATAVYSQDAWATIDGWARNSGSGTVGVSGGRLTVEAACNGIFKSIAGCAGKTLYIKMAAATAGSFTFALGGNPGATIAIPASTVDSVYKIQFPAIAASDFVGIAVTGVAFSVDSIWIGDYSYLPGSLSEEAARIADQLGDTAGVGVAASLQLTSSGVDPTPGKKLTILGKTYTLVSGTPSVEGDVKIATSSPAANTLQYLKAAIADGGITSYCYCAAAHPLVTATRVGFILTLTFRTSGIAGNIGSVTTDEPTWTLSGTTLSGGMDAVGEKIKTQLNAAIGAGAAVGAIPTKTATSILGYFAVVDCASGARVTLPAGGTWAWEVMTYGATYNSVKSGTAAGGAAITGTASANLCMRYERIA